MENKIQTLRKRSDFLQLKTKGKRVYTGSWLVLNFHENKQAGHRFGWTIPGQVANAVIRNRIKRWCREFFKQKEFGNKKFFDINVVIRTNKNEKKIQQIKHAEFINELEKAVAKIR